MKRDINSNSRQ